MRHGLLWLANQLPGLPATHHRPPGVESSGHTDDANRKCVCRKIAEKRETENVVCCRSCRGLALLIVCAGLLWVWVSHGKPVAWWRAEGNAHDSASHDDGILVGNATFSDGIIGKAFRFDGVGSYVKIPKFRMPDIREGITVEFWMKAGPNNKMDTYQGLVASDYFGVEIFQRFSPKMGVNFYVSSDKGRTWGAVSEANGGGATISAGEWHHIAATYDGADMVLYIDGQASGDSALLFWKCQPAVAKRVSCYRFGRWQNRFSKLHRHEILLMD